MLSKLFHRKKKVAFGLQPKTTPWGGGNQFSLQLVENLKAAGFEVGFDLKKKVDLVFLIDPRGGRDFTFTADDVREYKKKFPSVPCIHRINECDKRKGTDFIDDLLKDANEVADYTIFISSWLRDYFSERWYDSSLPNEVIYNAADGKIYHPGGESYQEGSVLRLVTHHWSDNWMKGFRVYKEIDDLIDQKVIQDVELVVVGQYPKEIEWKKARLIAPTHGQPLADELRKCHLYVTASQWEPCGMHHIEGTQCGLPILYHVNGGGINEFASKYGIAFEENFLEALAKMKAEYSSFRERVLTLNRTGRDMCEAYLSAVERVLAGR